MQKMVSQMEERDKTKEQDPWTQGSTSKLRLQPDTQGDWCVQQMRLEADCKRPWVHLIVAEMYSSILTVTHCDWDALWNVSGLPWLIRLEWTSVVFIYPECTFFPNESCLVFVRKPLKLMVCHWDRTDYPQLQLAMTRASSSTAPCPYQNDCFRGDTCPSPSQ